MRYLVNARLKPGCETSLLQAIENGTLGAGSIAGDEYVFNMQSARRHDDGTVRWVETCFCSTPLEEERPYWEQYFDLVSVRDAHARKNCRDLNGAEPWACCNCDCTKRLEAKLARTDCGFIETLRESVESTSAVNKQTDILSAHADQ